MPIDPSISLQAQTPKPMTRLADLASTANNILALQKGKATLSADIAQRQAESKRAIAEANVAEATQQPLIQQQQAITESAQAGAKRAQFDLTNALHQRTVDQITGLIGDESVRNGDVKGIHAALDAAAQNALRYGADPKDVEASITPLKQLAESNPKAVQPALINMLRQGLTGVGQAGVIQPSGPQINTGQIQYGVNTNPLAATPMGAPIAGTGAVNQIPVGTIAYDKNAQANYIVGPGGTGTQAGPALGEAPNVQGTVDVVNKDFADTQTEAANAGNAISILQNIKKYAQGAATGVTGTGGIASIVSDIARATGLSEGEVKTNTDLLAKNANMLALAGGDTNLARTLAEAANPNSKMNPESIRKAADQAMSLAEMKLAKQQYMSQFKNNPQQYAEKLAQFNQVADPRIWQLKNMTLKDKAEMKASMTPAEQQRFRSALEQAEAAGLVK